MKRMIPLVIILSLVLGGCTSSQPSTQTVHPTEEFEPVAGSDWKLIQIGGQPLLQGTAITLHFGAQLEGNAGCNDYKADYSMTSAQIQLTFFSINVMKCSSSQVMDQEKLYVQTFTRIATERPAAYLINQTEKTSQLHLLDQAGNTVLLYELIPPK